MEDGQEKRQVAQRRRYQRANRAGMMLLIMTVSQYGLTWLLLSLLRVSGMDVSARFWGLSAPLFLCLYLALYILMLGVPLAISARFLCPKGMNTTPVDPLSRDRRLCVIFFGVALCLLANMLASVFTGYLYTLGVPEPQLPAMADGSFGTLLLDMLVLAAVPAVLEEYLLRGLVLQTLRPFGDGVAVMVSALLFGLMHGNVRQAPYALLMGLVLGWIFIYTNNIRLTMVIHGISNALVLAVSYSLQFCTGGEGMVLQVAVIVIVLLLGIVGAVWLGRHPFPKRERLYAAVPLRQRLLMLCKAPLLWAAVGLMVVLLLCQL